MVARAYVLGLGRGAASPPVVPTGWSENWDEADYLALIAKYTASGFQFFADPGAFPAAASVFFVSGGTFQIVADGNPWVAEFGPAPFSPAVKEWWLKVVFVMAGGAFDAGPSNPPFVLHVDDATFALDATINTDAGGAHPYYAFAGPSGPVTDSAVNSAFPAGTHTFIICGSEDDSTHQRVELWIDAAPGATPDAVSVTPKTAGMGFSNLDITFNGPVASGLTLTVHPIQMLFSNRASDPFGIL